jgi:hypothetical protein
LLRTMDGSLAVGLHVTGTDQMPQLTQA